MMATCAALFEISRRLVVVAVLLGEVAMAFPADAPQNSKTLLLSGYHQLQEGKFNSAITSLKAGLELEPGNALGHFYLGKAYVGIGDNKSAVEEYRRSLAINDHSSVAEEARSQIRSFEEFKDRTLIAGKTYVGLSDEYFPDAQNFCGLRLVRQIGVTFAADGEHGTMEWTVDGVGYEVGSGPYASAGQCHRSEPTRTMKFDFSFDGSGLGKFTVVRTEVPRMPLGSVHTVGLQTLANGNELALHTDFPFGTKDYVLSCAVGC